MTPTAIANYSGKSQQKSMSLSVHTPLGERIPIEVDRSTYLRKTPLGRSDTRISYPIQSGSSSRSKFQTRYT